MKCWYLKSYDLPIPGAYRFEQTIGIYKKFETQPSAHGMATIVSGFRQGNNLPRSSLEETLKDVSCYQCWRLGNNPDYCRSSDAPLLTSNVPIPVVAPCKGCGAPISR